MKGEEKSRVEGRCSYSGMSWAKWKGGWEGWEGCGVALDAEHAYLEEANEVAQHHSVDAR